MKRELIWHCLTLVLLAGLLSACKPRQSTPPSGNNMEMRPFQEPTYEAGRPCEDAAKLLPALEAASTSKKMVKLPVFFERAESGIRSYEKAYIGTRQMPDGPQRVNLRLNDSALGVSLADRLSQLCPDAGGCCLWLAGYWNEKSVLDSVSEQSEGLHSFGIRAVLGLYKSGEPALAFIAK